MRVYAYYFVGSVPLLEHDWTATHPKPSFHGVFDYMRHVFFGRVDPPHTLRSVHSDVCELAGRKVGETGVAHNFHMVSDFRVPDGAKLEKGPDLQRFGQHDQGKFFFDGLIVALADGLDGFIILTGEGFEARGVGGDWGVCECGEEDDF